MPVTKAVPRWVSAPHKNSGCLNQESAGDKRSSGLNPGENQPPLRKIRTPRTSGDVLDYGSRTRASGSKLLCSCYSVPTLSQLSTEAATSMFCAPAAYGVPSFAAIAAQRLTIKPIVWLRHWGGRGRRSDLIHRQREGPFGWWSRGGSAGGSRNESLLSPSSSSQ
jgi:hypothetical protein